jgi:hypothetical protein
MFKNSCEPKTYQKKFDKNFNALYLKEKKIKLKLSLPKKRSLSLFRVKSCPFKIDNI